MTAGIYLLNLLMPMDLRFKSHEIINSKLLKERLTAFAKKDPQLYGTNVSKIAKLGEKMSFFMGSNVGLEDLEIEGMDQTAKLKKLEQDMDKEPSLDKKRGMLLSTFSGIIDDINKKKGDTTSTNEIMIQAASGSRGGAAQIARTSVSPIYAVDMNQLPKTTIIKNSFAKGLSPSEYFNVASQGRFSSVASANMTSEPGALSKILVANTEDQKITMEDCRTRNGEYYKRTDNHLVGRFLAGSNTLVTMHLFKELSRKSGKIKARSATTCEAKRGMCVKCYGLTASGQMVKVGENVGIVAAQALGQVSTQMALSVKHSTMGKNTGETKLTGIAGLNSLYSSKEKATGMAITAQASGTITSIALSTSGTIVTIGRKKHIIPSDKKIIVSQGTYIKEGKPLTKGVVAPSQLLKRRGIYRARSAEAEEAHSIFHRSTGKDMQKKHFEVISRGHLSLAVDKHGNHSSFEEAMSDYPRRFLVKNISKDLEGMYLAQNLGYIQKGTKITSGLLAKFKKWNIPRVPVTEQRPKVKPLYKSLEQRPLFNNSLFGKMNYRGIKKAVKDQVMYGASDEVHSDKSRYTAHF